MNEVSEIRTQFLDYFGKEGNNSDGNYLKHFQTEKEMKEALNLIKSIANKYYYSNPFLYKESQIEPEDLSQTIHLHLMMKYKNTGFCVTNFANLKTMCTMSMNSKLRSLKEDMVIKGTKIKDSNGKIIKTEGTPIYILSLTDLTTNTSDKTYSESTKEEMIFTDNGKGEEDQLDSYKLSEFLKNLHNENPIYTKVFKVQSFLNNNINLLTNEEQARVIKLFDDLLIRKNTRNGKRIADSPNGRNISLLDISSRLNLKNFGIKAYENTCKRIACKVYSVSQVRKNGITKLESLVNV